MEIVVTISLAAVGVVSVYILLRCFAGATTTQYWEFLPQVLPEILWSGWQVYGPPQSQYSQAAQNQGEWSPRGVA